MKDCLDIPQIAPRDELDHIDMYINHSMYSITTSEFPCRSHGKLVAAKNTRSVV